MKLTNEAYNKILLIISARLELMKELSGFVPSLENIKPAIEDAIAFSGIDCDEEDKNKLNTERKSLMYWAILFMMIMNKRSGISMIK